MNTTEIRICAVCRKKKPIFEFYFRDGGKRVRTECKVCINARNKKWYLENRDRANAIFRNSKRKKRYAKIGISEEGFQELLRRQHGRCAICRAKPKDGIRLAVDHDHKTGKVRGLLCKHCNQALGHFRDDPIRLQKAISYLTGQVTFS